MQSTKLLYLLPALCCFFPAGYAKTTLVSSMGELRQAADNLKAGDTLVLSAGRWESIELSLEVSGTAKAPVVVRGAEDGKTVITGRSWIGIGGRFITVRDLHFKGVEPPDDVDGIVTFRDSGKRESDNSRLTNCVFEFCNPRDPERRYKWVQVYGRKHRVDHNLFANQRHSGPTIQVIMSEADVQHRIDHNHFLDRPQGDGNGFETIQIGQSKDSEKVGNCLVDSNLFERCDGETEIISNKTCANIFRGNVFLESAGGFTLRHGNDCVVEGNLFIGKGKRLSYGVRVIGTGHVVRDNYFEGLYGRTGGVIVLYTGIPGSPLNGYFAAHDASIENNLLVNCAGTGLCLRGGYGERGRTILPTGVAIRGNLIHTAVDGAPQIFGTLPDVEFIGNTVTAGKAVGRDDLRGITEQAIQLARTDSGLLDAYGEDGKIAFEYNKITPRLLKRNEVGPSWFTALPKLGILNPDQISLLIRGENKGIKKTD